MSTVLSELGWSPWFEARFTDYRKDGHLPGRVVAAYGASCTVSTEHGDVLASTTGRLKHAAASAASLPAVGDWVVLRDSAIQMVLERRTAISRKAASTATEEQVLAANVDLVLIVTAVVDDFNLRRLERYVTLAWNSGAAPVVVLTKVDLVSSVAPFVDQAAQIALGIPIVATSAVSGDGLDELRERLHSGLTAVLVGSSGVGKSSLINRLLGRAALPTSELRRDGRGRHTSARRELLRLPTGGLVIDTPGLREVQLWAGQDDLDQAFDDVHRLAAGCRFNDCRHRTEPGCAVQQALVDGSLGADRFASYRKLERELRSLAVRADARLRREEGRRWRAIARAARDRARPG